MLFTASELGLFTLAALVLVLTPGPNMIYYVSRTICQGRGAGMISLAGVMVGFLFHMLAAALGLTALLLAVPFAYDAIKYAGAAYLLWMAWQGIRPGAVSPFQPRALPPDSRAKLFRMGLVTNLLNPKVAAFYLSLLPQFVHPERGSVLVQSIVLGVIQCTVSFTVNALIVCSAAAIARFFATHDGWLRAQRYVMATVLSGLALRLAMDERK